MPPPLISVVIPAYNHEQYIGAAIDSVLEQSISDLELIIVDDGSTDNTAKVIQSYDDPRISYTWQENQDAYNTINRGMGMARGAYISILNSDDVYTKDRLEKCLAYAEEHGSEVIFTDVIPISDQGETIDDPHHPWIKFHQNNRNHYLQYNDLYTGFLHGNYMVTTSNLFMTKSAVDKTGGFANLRYLHDYDYIFRLMLSCPDKVTYLKNDKLLHYRLHGSNTISQAAIIGREQDLDIIEKYMLAILPESYRQYVQTGSIRLRQLEQELLEAREQAALFQILQSHSLPRRFLSKIRRTVSEWF